MSTTCWFILSLLPTLVYAGHFTNVCKQLNSNKVHVMAMGSASGQQSFILLVDTMNYAKAHLNSLTFSSSSSSDATFNCSLAMSNKAKVLKMVRSNDRLRWSLKDVAAYDYVFGIYTITVDRVDYFTVYLVLRSTTYQLLSRIDVNGTVSDDFKFNKLPFQFTSDMTVLSSATPSVVYVLVGGSGCLTRIKLEDGQLERAQFFALREIEYELSNWWSIFKIIAGTHPFLNNAHTLRIEQSTTDLCINGPQSIDGGYYDDKVDVLMGFNNKHHKLYIFRNLKLNSNAPPVKVLNWSQFLVCPQGGTVALPKGFVPGFFNKSERKPGNMLIWITVALLIVLIVAIVLTFFLVKHFGRPNG